MRSTALLGMAAALLLLPGVASGRATRAQRMRVVSNTTIAFSDDPLVPGVTPLKAVHMTELRNAVNLARIIVGLPATIFNDQPPDGLGIKGTHIAALRTAFDEARSALGYPTMAYTDPNLTTSTKIRAKHFQELRDALRMLINWARARNQGSEEEETAARSHVAVSANARSAIGAIETASRKE